MRRMLGLAVLLTACGAAISACADHASTAPPAPGPSLKSNATSADIKLADGSKTAVGGQVVTVLKRTVGLDHDVVASWLVDQKGRELDLPSLGLQLVIPKGALPGPTLITIKAPAGELVTYEFEPHGIQFAVPVEFVQDLKYTNAYKMLTNGLKGGYYPDPSTVDDNTETAVITEEFPVTVDALSKAKFDIKHFSGYLLASGRSGVQ